MAATRAALGLAVAVAVGAVVVSGGSGVDPRTPAALPGMPPPFLGVAVVGHGGRTAAVDAYGNVVDLRAPGPGGPAVLAVPAARQAAGTVAADSSRVARMWVGGRSMPLWRADSVRQTYLPGTNVLRTVARVGDARATVVHSLGAPGAARSDRRWLARARPLGARAPGWARRLYRRSLLVLRALTDRRTGATVAGARDGWAYVWPRDAGAVGIAFAAAGYDEEAKRIACFLLGLDLGDAARFHGDGTVVGGRDAQGDAAGWVEAAAEAAGLRERPRGRPWRGLADYQEGDAGDYLANAIASAGVEGAETRVYGGKSHRRRELGAFEAAGGLLREGGEPDSGLESAAAWAVEPFPQPALFPLVRTTLLRLAAESGRYGIVPSQSWGGGNDPWTAPTAWTAWGLAALGERGDALHLMGALRRAATPLGLLPERVDARTGLPTSTTPLAWSHAFAILVLRELWP